MNLSAPVLASHVALESGNTRLLNISREESLERALENMVEFQAARTLQTFIPPLLIVFGTIGNVVTLVFIHCVQRSRKHSVLTYMFAMTVGNSLSLDLGYGLNWLSYNAGLTHIANQFDTTCRIWQFAINVISHVSGWIMTSLLIDRILTVHRANSGHLFTTVFVAKLVVVFICVGLTVISLHAMWIFELTETGNHQHQCVIDRDREDVETLVWPWVSAIVCSYLPNVLVVVLTTMLIVLKNRSTFANDVEDKLSAISIRLCLHYLISCLPLVVLNLVMYVGNAWQQPPEVVSRYILSDTMLTLLANSFYGSAFISALLTLASFRGDSKRMGSSCDCVCCGCYINDSPKKTKRGRVWGSECAQQKQLLEATSSNKNRNGNGSVAGQTETVL